MTTEQSSEKKGSSDRAKVTHFVFTKKSLDALPTSTKADNQWQWYYDIRSPGLAIGVGTTGVKTFYLVRKVAGNSKRYSIGKYPTIDVDVARKAAQELNAKIAQGIDPKKPAKDEVTFGALFEKFMNEYAYRRNRTADQSVEEYKRYLATNRYGVNLEKKLLKDITKADIRKIFAGISAHAPVHANRVLALVRSVINRGINWEIWGGENPCKGIERNPEVSRERFVSSLEFPALFQALDFEPNTTLRDFVYVALFTGARRSNVLPMRWEDIDFDGGVWRIGRTKNGSPQTIPLVPTLAQLLKDRRQEVDSEWVFPANSKSGHYVEPKAGWKTILERATGLRLIQKLADAEKWTDDHKQKTLDRVLQEPRAALDAYVLQAAAVKIDLKPLDMRDIRVHDLRRTLGSWQANMNVSLAIIGRTLNHKSPQSTKVYARLSLDPVRDAMTAATSAMLEHKPVILAKRSDNQPT